jgi:hypothetical protein
VDVPTVRVNEVLELMFWLVGSVTGSRGVADRAGRRTCGENLDGISAGQRAARDAGRNTDWSLDRGLHGTAPGSTDMHLSEVCRLLKRPLSVLSSLVSPLIVD